MTEEIRILARPDPGTHRCRFEVDRPVHEGRVSFGDRASAEEGSPLALRIFDMGHVVRVEIGPGEVVVTQDGEAEWPALAKAVGAAIRAQISSDEPAVKPGWTPKLDPDEAIREKVQGILDEEINPAVSMHGGFINVLDVKQGRVYIRMGGGCQGCGAADMTLRQGVERTIRERVPEVVALVDATDHESGANPYYAPAK